MKWDNLDHMPNDDEKEAHRAHLPFIPLAQSSLVLTDSGPSFSHAYTGTPDVMSVWV